MEFTKDLMFHIKYEQDEGVIKLNKENTERNNFLDLVKKHKFITCMSIAGLMLISADVILINDFINLLRQL